MPPFEPKNADYRQVATVTFARQQAMRTLDMSIARLEPGEVDLSMPIRSLGPSRTVLCMPGSSPQGSIPPAALRLHADAGGLGHPDRRIQDQPAGAAKGERFFFRAHVVKPGRTLTVCEARAFAQDGGAETLIATMTGTLMAMMPRA